MVICRVAMLAGTDVPAAQCSLHMTIFDLIQTPSIIEFRPLDLSALLARRLAGDFPSTDSPIFAMLLLNLK
ncbi:hypothetical protein DYH55_01835 [Methylovirgula sp. 4M-Z18]|nr:hypothetical protein DYH55_01835 [Methylovirgula sp. 4M-Z18]